MTAPEGTVEIPVGEYMALADEADAELVGRYQWRPGFAKSGDVYAYTIIDTKVVYMHRLLIGTPADMHTDHRNGNTLDNRRSNLRPATRSQNGANAAKQDRYAGKATSSRFKGVSLSHGRWQATVRLPGGRNKYLGRFDDEIEAALAYDAAAREVFGEFARPNFTTAARQTA
jgi:hypothetical protein